MSDTQLSLTGRPAGGPVRFEWRREPWKLERLDLLTAEVPDLKPAELPQFCEAVARSPRPWLVVRRLFGVRPLALTGQEDPDDVRLWGRTELEAALGVTRKQLQAELDAARGAWIASHTVATEAAAATAAVSAKALAAKAAEFTGELSLEAEAEAQRRLLAQYDFPESWFDLADRAPDENRRERHWFTGRLLELAKLFAQPQVREAARRLVLAELRLRRKDSITMTGGDRTAGKRAQEEFFSAYMADEKDYRAAMEQIQTLAPWFFAIGNALNAKGCFGEWVRAYQEWHGQGDPGWLAACAHINDAVVAPGGTVDGYFTAEELQTLARPHVEVPEPQYRLSLAVYAQMVRQGVWDPKWENRFPNKLWACLDQGFRSGFMEAWKREGLALPNLLKEGDEGEHLNIQETNEQHR